MTRQKVIQLIQQIKPTCVGDLEPHMKCRKLNAGCSRQAVALSGQLVIKFLLLDCSYNRRHSRKDVYVTQMINSNQHLKHLRRYCPKIFYYDYQSAVIAMEKLTPSVGYREASIVEDMFRDSLCGGRDCLDFGPMNMGKDARGQIKVLDFGCVPIPRRRKK